MSTRILACLLLVASAAGCGGGGGSGGPTTPPPTVPLVPASPNDILVRNNLFNPTPLTVAAGTTVTWTWAACVGDDPYGYGTGTGQTCVDHGIVWDNGVGTPSALQSEGTYQRTFATAGTYTYHCANHGTAMSGSVVVQ